LLEYYGCALEVINNKDLVREAMVEAARRANATIVADVFHRFNPHGISGVVVIAESHVAIHSWPEHLCASVDIFSCSDKMSPEVIEDFLKDVFQAERVTRVEIERGRIPVLPELVLLEDAL
jgi:S-adenosylmethionine decarboxylase proenzyme